ncbi:MAG: peptide chain release factor N(5)-glutamine methyltransferase [Planctomycetes bacterium]|nr:peptide chain release factor N(5)-glutamine methyltransferase [Planctomycetota bacterium]
MPHAALSSTQEALTLEDYFHVACQHLKKHAIENPANEAYTILSHLLNKDIAFIISRFKETIHDGFSKDSFWEILNRRSQNEPMAYIFGEREFFGKNFSVGPGVLIPRPETEHLLEWVMEDHVQKPFTHGIDLCTGSGIIGLCLGEELSIPFECVDTSDEALQWTRKNLEQRVNFKGDIHKMDILTDLPGKLGKVDLITMNPPYIPSADIHHLSNDVKDFEPHLALDGGVSGLEFLDMALKEIQSIAQIGCHLYLELGFGQKEILSSINLNSWKLEGWRDDLAGIPRIAKLTFLSE